MHLFAQRKKIIPFIQEYLFNPSKMVLPSSLLLLTEVILSIFIVFKVKYTEIDWVAYMQEVEGFLNGTLDYAKLEGQTGPLVYPAGFVYIYSAFYKLTDSGKNIRLGQFLFVLIYIVNLALVFNIYHRAKKIPPYVLVFMCCSSYRIHSIYMLRLFNDPIAMLFLYACVNALLYNRFSLGCILFSLGVSVKMNVLLFAPGLLIVLLYHRGIFETLGHLAECAIIQVLLAMPFLIHNTPSYLGRAFEFQRQFLFKWTVNWRFLPVAIFEHRGFHLALFASQLFLLVVFFGFYIRYSGGLKNFIKLHVPNSSILPDPDDILYPMFISNLLGLAFSRSLHYQFYVWYFHTLPYLFWTTNFRSGLRLLLLGVIEMCWNTYPSTVQSSAALHLCHATLILGLVYKAYKTQTRCCVLCTALKSKTT